MTDVNRDPAACPYATCPLPYCPGPDACECPPCACPACLERTARARREHPTRDADRIRQAAAALVLFDPSTPGAPA
jgi:hypothetical protein